jgi:penicillin-binding protein 1B
VLAAAVVALLLIGGAVFSYYYSKYGQIVDDRLSRPLFENTPQIYAAPREVRVGQKLTAGFLASELRAAGYSEDGNGPTQPIGSFSLGASSIMVHPGPQSYHAQDGATINFESGLVSQLTGDNGQALAAYELEPLLITGLSEEKTRTKRRLVTYDELPPQLVEAVTSIEDRRFFEHSGVDYYSMAGWTWHDLRGDRRYAGGASTLTMQLAKMFFLTPERTFKRKFIQVIITFQLEHRFSKQKIFQMYANEVPMGQRGSFAINGFGEAAQAYFNKDVRELTLPECAVLAGMIQSPSRLNPYRHPERMLERRNVVLDSMVETGSITKVQAENAKAAPLKLAANSAGAGEAPYFVDLVSERLHQRIGDTGFDQGGLRIYTSLDPELQRAAEAAVEAGMRNVDEIVAKAHTHRAKDGTVTTEPFAYPQVALVALNPHTGQVLALVGGRNYGLSQLDHAIANRPTGSIFKPFVYATAFNTSLAGTELEGQTGIFTPVTMLNDEPTTFSFDNGNQSYAPHNYKDEYHGQVTAIYALAHSLNNATISLAQMVGFGNVASLARDAGIKSARGTPSIALGAYSASPLDMAGAYTVFANGGVKIDPWMLASVRSADGSVLDDYAPTSRPVLDPRVAYLTTNMMEGVMNFGYGYEVRRRGFMAPAAGKTGTSNDVWFAAYTSNLLCVVWIGNDDYTDVKLFGATAAGPIWADFMKRAVELPQYSDTREFVAPPGVVQVKLDKVTNLLSDANCPDAYDAAFLDGSQPTDTCDHANGDQRNLFQKLFGLGGSPKVVPPTEGQPAPPVQGAPPQKDAAVDGDGVTTAGQPQKKKGFFSRVFGGKEKQPGDAQRTNPQDGAPAQPQPPQ